MVFKVTKTSVDLSEQQIVDCARGGSYPNLGCSGGYSDSALDYIINTGEIVTEASYPVNFLK